jgi:cellulose synthase (UDP-forming)
MSNSRIGYVQFRRRARLRKSVGCIYVAAALAYLGYRATIINESALTLSLIYLGAEIIGFGIGLAMIYSSWNYNHREVRPAPKGLSVDVLVPVYREPLEIIRWTLMAAREIEYPHQTLVLDDGNRADVRALAGELGIRYFARERNVDAKAGNLNHGLAHSRAEFVMVFDADHIPLPHALDVMLGFFDDEQVALVQTPQDYYNTDAFAYYDSRRSGRLWHDQSFFYNIVLPLWCTGAPRSMPSAASPSIR